MLETRQGFIYFVRNRRISVGGAHKPDVYNQAPAISRTAPVYNLWTAELKSTVQSTPYGCVFVLQGSETVEMGCSTGHTSILIWSAPLYPRPARANSNLAHGSHAHGEQLQGWGYV